MQRKNPWGYNNRDLLGMYAGASADGECPLVVEDSTPSCGDSRFGCWVCTLVEKDKSMTAMVQNDAVMEWMPPLLELRNLIDFREDSFAKDHITGETLEVHTPDAYWMFDQGLWTAIPEGDEFLVRTAVNRFTEFAPHGPTLASLSNRPLHFHKNARLRPHVGHFEWHRKRHGL